MGIEERREREKERRRNEIIDAAEKIFFSRGYKEATVDEIAEEAELSKGTVYIYFNSKDDLYHAIIMRGVGILSSMFRKALLIEGSGIEKVRAIGEAYLSFFREYPDYFNSLIYLEGHSTKKFPPENPLVYVIEAVREGIEDDSIRRELHPVKTSILLWGQMTGVLQIAYKKSEAFEGEYAISADEILACHMEQTLRMLKSEG